MATLMEPTQGSTLPMDEDELFEMEYAIEMGMTETKEGPPAKRGLEFPEDKENQDTGPSKRLRVERKGIDRKKTQTQHLLKRPVLGEDSLGCLLPDGNRYFIQFSDPYSHLDAPLSSSKEGQKPDTSYIDSLLGDLEQLRKVEEEKAPVAKPASGTASNVLWVDKYAPATFQQLLSPEKINRNVLRWIKLWDARVRGRDNHALMNAFGPKQHAKKFGWGWDPDARILLIAGPPGIGKTTLAHVAAKQAKYRPVEINASDDRSAEGIRTLIGNAMQMQSMFAGREPAAIIVDEVDGMNAGPGGGIRELLRMVEATATHSSYHDKLVTHEAEKQMSKLRQGKEKGPPTREEPGEPGQKKQKALKITRPIICIANDLYAPCLRELRKAAHVIDFPSFSKEKLTNRLKVICRAEGLNVTTDGLTALADVTGNDIRSCLNTLQFIKAKVGNEPIRITSESILRTAMGSKDQAQSLFEVWNAVFNKPKNRGSAVVQAAAPGSSALDKAHVMTFNALAATSDSPILLNGIYENFPNILKHDPTMRKSSAALDWLCFADECLAYLGRHQLYGIARYLPAVGHAIHNLTRSEIRVKASFPRQMQQMRVEKNKKQGIVESLLHGRLSSGTKEGLGLGAKDVHPAVLDVVTPLLSIVSPPLKPSNFSLLNTREKRDLEDAVNVLMSFGANYRPQKEYRSKASRSLWSDDDIQYELDPEIHQLVEYKGYEPDDKPDLAQIVRQLIAAEVNSASIRRKGPKFTGPAPERGNAVAMPSYVTAQLQGASGLPDAKSPSSGGNAAAPKGKHDNGPSPLTQKARTHGFAAFFKKSSAPKEGKKDSKAVLMAKLRQQRPPIVFKFQEGFTNAVRRPLKLGDLLAQQ